MFKRSGGDAIERYGPAECCFYSQRREGYGVLSGETAGTIRHRGPGMNSPAFPPPAQWIQEVKDLRDPSGG